MATERKKVSDLMGMLSKPALDYENRNKKKKRPKVKPYTGNLENREADRFQLELNPIALPPGGGY